MSITIEAVTYNGHTVDPSTLPAATLNALFRRGVTHFLGNEQSSKVTTWAKAQDELRAKAEPKQEPVTTAEREAKRAECFAAALAAMTAGEIGNAARGPAVDPVEAEMERIAKREVLDVLRGANIKVPKKDEAVKFANGTSKTLDEMVDTRLERFGERLRGEAEKAIKARERAKAKTAVAVADLEKTPDALGL